MFFKGSKRRLRMTVFISYKRNKWSQTAFLLISWKFSSGETPFCNYLPLPMPQSQTKSKRKKKIAQGLLKVKFSWQKMPWHFSSAWIERQSNLVQAWEGGCQVWGAQELECVGGQCTGPGLGAAQLENGRGYLPVWIISSPFMTCNLTQRRYHLQQ